MPPSLCSRLGCYIPIKKDKEGIAKQIGHAALLKSNFFNVAVLVDDDINVFDEKDVLWSVASNTDFLKDVDLVKNSYTLFNTAAGYQKIVIDATRPLSYAFPERFKVPDDVMDTIDPEQW